MRNIVYALCSSGFIIASCAGCPAPRPQPGPPPDAGPPPAIDASDSCTLACANLTKLGCKEGADPDCAVTLQHEEQDRLVRMSNGMPMTCAAVASAVDVGPTNVGCTH